jgi:hypothetical protein
MIGEIPDMLHDPPTLLGLLPLIYWLGYIDIYIIYVSHVKRMELQDHVCIVTGSVV